MLDIKFIRENLDLVKMAAKKKRMQVDLDELVKLDESRRALLQVIESKKSEQNAVSPKIAAAGTNEERLKLIEEMQVLKGELQIKEEELKDTMGKWQTLMLQVPNIPDMTVPDGESDADNVEIRTWGERTAFSFEPKDHIEIMLAHKMVDFERGAKVHGFRGYYLLGDGARLMWAIWNYANDFFSQRSFVQMIPPTIVRKQNLYGTGHLPNDVDDIYRTQDDDYLIGTSEVPGMGFYADEVLDQEQLPVKFLAFSPCYRREAGSHSKDVKGLIRVHEFYKVEQIVICEASHEESVKWHEEITKNTEEFMQSLGIPHRVVLNCGADIGQGQVKKYDIEAWVPKEEKYRETHSASYFHDFQTRRFNIRYRDGDGKVRYAHSLNNTAVAAPRILVSLIENFQQADGSVKLPAVLHTYFGKDSIR
jgi:seryl-tRNA synthetase